MKTTTRFGMLAAASAFALGTLATAGELRAQSGGTDVQTKGNAAETLGSDTTGNRFDTWDTDRSGTIDRDEFSTGAAESGQYDDWVGEKPYLTRQEFHRAIGDTSKDDMASFDSEQAFDTWDADQNDQLTEDEFNQGWYRNYDRDESGDLDESEFGMFEEDADKGGWFE